MLPSECHHWFFSKISYVIIDSFCSIISFWRFFLRTIICTSGLLGSPNLIKLTNPHARLRSACHRIRLELVQSGIIRSNPGHWNGLAKISSSIDIVLKNWYQFHRHVTSNVKGDFEDIIVRNLSVMHLVIWRYYHSQVIIMIGGASDSCGFVHYLCAIHRWYTFWPFDLMYWYIEAFKWILFVSFDSEKFGDIGDLIGQLLNHAISGSPLPHIADRPSTPSEIA